ncbi:MAG: hypothetical protein GWP91_09995 [Rhodobacterales bacterium]|nr:hypothetical protein [Rhodobacterales bacterium]
MSASRHSYEIESIARDLDLVVFRLERAAPTVTQDIAAERARIRSELEQIRDRMTDIVRALDR